MDFLIFLVLFAALCGWLDQWATRAAEPTSGKGH
ncbi:hypothetical protein HD595_007623 [Nonomuraea roseoviolacea subsp. carminata]|uniref:Uncharacterized protein n=1 Tax=Nonomuraea roseoviolacea subsp. carminata TaxID=160689 RepID=A0ABT1KDR6_9ACTN|nr:hypothetical protein [Nonomuraea roseoviolacea subsp. carminata]